MSLTTATAVDEAASWRVRLEDRPVAIATSPTAAAVLGGEGRLLVIDEGGAVLGRASLPVGGLVAAWSPDGRRLAVGGPLGAAIWTSTGGLVPLAARGWCGALSWAEDGRLAAATGRLVSVYDFADGEAAPIASWQTPDAPSTVTGLTWLRDGRELAVAAYGGVTCFAPGKAQPARQFAYVGSLLDITASSNGRWLVSGNQDASVHIWRTRDGAELEMAGFPGKVSVVEFHSGARWLYADGGDQPTIWDFSGPGPGGRQPAMLQLSGLIGSTHHAWHPREPLIAAADSVGEVGLWEVTGLTAGEINAPQAVVAVAGEALTALAWFGSDALIVATESGDVFFLGQ